MIAVVQVRGEVNQSEAVADTLEMLNLGRVNHATFVPETDAYRGMVTKVNDWVAHGEPSEDVVALLLERRAEPAEGAADVDDAWVEENTDYADVPALASALVDEETTLSEQGLSPTLRLHPPRGGHDGIKHPTTEKGQLGKHTSEGIDELLEVMR
ncbi:50S ribosomal protein L30 [Natronomonas marina]|jgi:large subunit ribosomal protein L30|uniref:50S ribosomal protein L30 n=1 Tax=Natronomonas marina TaxID=2961939 RepID=UPI0020CA1565|nr:50S ribosomal protein L30 [Natronomonas marina]